jgi:hypothetical protein
LLYANIAREFKAHGPVRVAADRRTGVALLLHSDASLALPRPLSDNDGCRSLIYGQQAIVRATDVQSLYEMAAMANHADLTSRIEPRALVEQRLGALTSVLPCDGR